MRIVLLFLLLWSWPACSDDLDIPISPAQAIQGEPRFQPMGSDRQYAPEIITEVMFDKVGFLWVGTREGLLLNDGQDFRRFQHEVQNPNSISSNGVRGVFEDSRGRLWINTISGGLNLLDRASWNFRSWRHQRNDPDSLIHDGVFDLAEAPEGQLWVGTQAGLDLFDPDSGKFTRTVLATGGEFAITLLSDRHQRLWVGTLGQGLFRQRADHQGFDAVPFARAPPQLDIFSLAEDANGVIWVGTRFGLYRADTESGRLVEADAGKGGGKKVANVTSLLSVAGGDLWVASFGAGLYRKKAHSDELIPAPLGVEGSGALHIDTGALALAPDGTLFVGTFGSGLLRASPRLVGLRSWSEHEGGQSSPVNQDVYALQSAPQQGEGARLLVGSFGGGVDEILLPQGTVKHATMPGGAEVETALGGVTDLLLRRDGVLWATTNEGVWRWNRARDDFHYYSPEQDAAVGVNPEYSFALLEDHLDRLWVGSAGGGLFLHRPEDDTFRNFRPVPGDPDSLPDDFVTVLIEDRRNRLWVGTRSGGIGMCRYDGELRCSSIETGLGAVEVSHDHITSLLEASDDAIWVGTAGGGLNRLALDEAGNVASVRRWARTDGLDDDNVMALVFAPDGALWMSTHGGLSRLDTQTGQLTNLTPADGLPTAMFNTKAAVLESGHLYFGSIKGVVAIDPLAALPQRPPPATIIESVSGLDAEHAPSSPMWQLDTLRVPWRTPFSLGLAVLGYDGGQPRFQYRMGAGADWTDLGGNGQLTLHAMDAGRHRLEVRGRTGGHGWTDARPLTLDIVPPWWRKTEVQAGASLLALFALFAVFWWRVRELQARNRELHRLHGLRELALAEAKDSQERLGEAFGMLRRMTMRLEAAKEKERKHLARELHDEFGQALTTVKINLGLALQQAPSESSRMRVGDTIGVIDHLIGQVRALSLDLRPPLLDELGLVPALEGYLHGVAERSGLQLKLRLDPRLARAATDREITVFRIVQEAVTNVVRHAGASTLEVELDATEDGVAIRVRDDGAGFDAAQILADTGSGLGLFGMRERVHDLGGRLTVESQPDCGTLISAFIPADSIVEP